MTPLQRAVTTYAVLWAAWHPVPVTAQGELDDLTAAELAFATAIGVVEDAVADSTTISMGPVSSGWQSAAYAPTVDKLFAAPTNAGVVLVVDPATNSTATLRTGTGGTGQWLGIAFAASVNKLFAAPSNAGAVLIVDPTTNVTDVTALGGFSATSPSKWHGIAWVPGVNKLYAAPHMAESVLVVDPTTNTTDATALRGFGVGGSKWKGITYVSSVNKLYCAPWNAVSVLIIDPVTNATDRSVLDTANSISAKYFGAAYVPTVNKLFFSPYNARNVFVVDLGTNTTYGIGGLTGMSGLQGKYRGIAYAPHMNKLFSAPANAPAVLIIDPVANTTDVTSLAGLSGSAKWAGIVSVPTVRKLFAMPLQADSVLVIGGMAGWPVSNGVATVLPTIRGNSVYPNASLLRWIRLPADTTELRLAGPGLADPATLAWFANWTSDITLPLILNLTGHEFTVLPPRFLEGFGGHVGVLDLSRGAALTSVGPGAFGGLSMLRELRLGGNGQLETLTDGWLQGQGALATLDLARCGLTQVTNRTFAEASALTILSVASNPVISMDTDPFASNWLLEPSSVNFRNMSIVCIAPLQGPGGRTVPQCLGCAVDDGNNYTVFRPNDGIGRDTCERPTVFVGLNNVTQYIPSAGGTGTELEYLTWQNRTIWAVHRTYRIQPVQYSSSRFADGRSLDNTGAVRFEVDSDVPGLFIDVRTAEMLFRPLAPRQPRHARVMAMHQGYEGTAVVAHMTFEVRVEDVLNGTATGPNAIDCLNGGRRADVYDGVHEFDGSFHCDCSGSRFSGVNCEVPSVTMVFPVPVTQIPEPDVPEALEWGDRRQWAINRSYFLQPALVRAAARSNGGALNVSELRYIIQPAPAGLLIDATTAFAQLTPRTAGRTDAVVYATHLDLPDAEIGRVVFDVLPDDVSNPVATGPNGRPCANGGARVDTYDGTSEFDLAYQCQCVDDFSGPNCEQLRERPRLFVLSAGQYIPPGSALVMETPGATEDPSTPTYARYSRTLWAREQTYRIAPINITRAVVSRTTTFNWSLPSSQNLSADVTPTFELDPLPRGLFIDSATAELVGQPDFLGVTLATLFALYPGALRAPVVNLNFTVVHQDTAVQEYGPGGQDCNNAGQRVDVVPFDGRFTCDCSRTSTVETGPNCNQLSTIAASGSDSGTNSSTVIAVAVVVLILVVTLSALYARYQRSKAFRPHDFTAELQKLLNEGVIRMVEGQNRRMPPELPREKVRLLDVLGAGAFGEVYKGLILNKVSGTTSRESMQPVAVKTLKGVSGDVNREEKDALMAEATIAAQFEHPNVIELIGVVTSGLPLMIIFELCEGGELKAVVSSGNVSASQKTKWLFGIAKGMAYLAELGFVHRDLAARNVLIGSDDEAKIADFGMSRDTDSDEYYVSSGGKVPVRWTSVEAMTQRKYSEFSDVWAFGITCYEVWTNGARPYNKWPNAVVMEQVQDGFTLPYPEGSECPRDLYDACMRPCWEYEYRRRPPFKELAARLAVFAKQDFDPAALHKAQHKGRVSATTSRSAEAAVPVIINPVFVGTSPRGSQTPEADGTYVERPKVSNPAAAHARSMLAEGDSVAETSYEVPVVNPADAHPTSRLACGGSTGDELRGQVSQRETGDHTYEAQSSSARGRERPNAESGGSPVGDGDAEHCYQKFMDAPPKEGKAFYDMAARGSTRGDSNLTIAATPMHNAPATVDPPVRAADRKPPSRDYGTPYEECDI